MIDLAAFKAFLEPFGWFLTLGKTETDHIKQEIQDLLQHSSQSLRSLIRADRDSTRGASCRFRYELLLEDS